MQQWSWTTRRRHHTHHLLVPHSWIRFWTACCEHAKLLERWWRVIDVVGRVNGRRRLLRAKLGQENSTLLGRHGLDARLDVDSRIGIT